MRIAITLAVIAALGSQAHAGGDVGVVVTGDGALQPQLTAHIEDWLSRHGHTLVPAALPSEVIPQLVDCFVVQDDPKGCARRLIEARAKSSAMIYAQLHTDTNTNNGARVVTLTAYWFDRGHEALAERETCESCTDQLLRSTADQIMKRLVGVIAAGHVKLNSVPAGARISIDGAASIGVTPLEWDLVPGQHVIRMEKPGYAPESRDIVVISDRKDTVTMELSPPGESAQPSKLLPVGAMAVGGALIVTGGVLIAINQNPGFDQPEFIHHTKPAGIGLAAGGVVVGVLGAYLWWRSSKTTSAPVAAITSDGPYIGWAGRF